MYANGELAEADQEVRRRPATSSSSPSPEMSTARQGVDRPDGLDSRRRHDAHEGRTGATTPDLLHGLLRTLEYTVAGLRRRRRARPRPRADAAGPDAPVRVPAAIYTELFKNIPLLAIIFIIYFGLPSAGLRLDALDRRLAQPDRLLRGLPLGDLPRRARRRPRRPAGGRAGAGDEQDADLPAGDHAAGAAAGPARHGNTMLVDLLKSTSLLVTISAGELMSRGTG